MAARGQIGTGPLFAAGLLLVFCYTLKAFPRNAPGVLPWALKASDNTAKNQKSRSSHRKPKGRNKRPGRRVSRQSSWGLVQSLRGVAYAGLETDGSSLGETRTRENTDDLGFGIEEQGFLFDPRLWSHTLSLQMSRSAFSLPLQSNVINSLGVNFNGVMFQSRSFPFRISYSRQRANTDFSGPYNTRTNYSNLGLSWSLNKPKLANVTLNAMFGKTNTDNFTTIFLPFRERQQAFSGTVSRSFDGWSVEGNASYSRVRSSLYGYQYILREQGLRVQRPVGDRGNWTTSLHRFLRSESDSHRPWTRFALTAAQTSLTYRHSKKLRGFYNVNYLSNIREAAIASALTSSTGQNPIGPGVQPNPALQQALLSSSGNSSFTGQAGWNYMATDRLSFDARVGETLLNNPGIPVDDEPLLLKGFTMAGGGVDYRRRFGSWTASWRGSIFRNWNRRKIGGGYADDNRSIGVGITHPLSRWMWTSNLSYTEYMSEALHGSLYRQERWENSIETRYRRLTLNLGAELLHLNSNYSTLEQFTQNGENGLLVHGTFASRRWSASVGQGLRNVNSAIFTLDLANPLNSVLLSEVTPLVSPLTNADRYTYVIGNYRLRPNLLFQGSYRKDRFTLSGGDLNSYTDLDVSLAYRIGRLRVAVGFRQLQQEALHRQLGRNQIYFRVIRPFTIF